MSYTTYLFDFDYTLADSSRGIVTCFRNVLTQHGYTEVTDDDIKRTIGKTLEESFSILTQVTDAGKLAEFKAQYRQEADTHMTVNTVLFLETKSVLVALKDAGARIGIISTKYRYRIKELLDQHFPENFMDIIVGGEDVETAKPSPEGLLFALKQLHASKAETLYIGDSTIDAETARAAGVDFAGVTHGVTTAKELAKYPHWKIMASLEELLENEEEQPHASRIDTPILPGSDSAALPQTKKRIGIWQIFLLLLLLWFALVELDLGGEDPDKSFLFPTIFLFTLWGILRKRRVLPKAALKRIASWWHPYAVRLRALHIKLIRGKEVPSINNETSVCQNCGTTYTGNYCYRCGQSRNTPRYRLSNALRNIAGGFFNIDSGFGRTLLDLLHRPGYMIRDFIGGKRIQYFRPFQTLFILAALYIMTVQLVDPEALNPQRDAQKQEQVSMQKKGKLAAARQELEERLKKAGTEEEKQSLDLAIKEIREAETKQGKDSTAVNHAYEEEEEEDAMDEIINLITETSQIGDKIERFARQSPFLMKVWNLLKSWGHGNKAFRIIATLPLFALATQLAFRRRKYKLNYNTTEHVFIQAYIACQVLLLSILVLPFNGHARVDDLYELPIWFIFVLFCWDYKQLYRCSWWRSFWRTILMFCYSLLILFIFATVVVTLALIAIRLLKPFLA